MSWLTKISQTQTPVTGQPFSVAGHHATVGDFDQFNFNAKPRTKSTDLTAQGVFFYGEQDDAKRLYLENKPRRVISRQLSFRNPFVFRRYNELYEYTGVDFRDPDKARKNTAILKNKGHDGFIKLFQSKPGIDEMVVFDPSQILENKN